MLQKSLTTTYHNLLQKNEGGNTQSYLWDVNVAGMTENGKERYYFQDELGSPIRLMDQDGEAEESYGYDEFGQDLYGNQGMVQPFGYTGYQADRITGTYYAQAREYRAGLGRFAAVDSIKGFTVAPYTLNEYGYCWNNPMVLVDWDGRFPGLIVIGAPVVSAAVSTSIGIEEVDMDRDDHYDRNSNQEDYFEQFYENKSEEEAEQDIIRMVELGEDGWYPADNKDNLYHRFTNGNQGEDAVYNVKYLRVNEDGSSYEIIICQGPGTDDDYIVDADQYPENAGTYNYYHPGDIWGRICHGWKDVLPYIFQSNTPDDGLTFCDRVFVSGELKTDTLADYVYEDNSSGECIN